MQLAIESLMPGMWKPLDVSDGVEDPTDGAGGTYEGEEVCVGAGASAGALCDVLGGVHAPPPPMFTVCPAKIRFQLPLNWGLSASSVDSDSPCSDAMPDSVWPGCTVTAIIGLCASRLRGVLLTQPLGFEVRLRIARGPPRIFRSDPRERSSL